MVTVFLLLFSVCSQAGLPVNKATIIVVCGKQIFAMVSTCLYHAGHKIVTRHNKGASTVLVRIVNGQQGLIKFIWSW